MVQECGRAGRDGQRSSCVLFYSYSDYVSSTISLPDNFYSSMWPSIFLIWLSKASNNYMFLFHLSHYIASLTVYLQIRVKHMLSQGTVEQSPFTSGQNRLSSTNSGRIVDTNMENLLRMVHVCLMLLTLALHGFIFLSLCS